MLKRKKWNQVDRYSKKYLNYYDQVGKSRAQAYSPTRPGEQCPGLKLKVRRQLLIVDEEAHKPAEV